MGHPKAVVPNQKKETLMSSLVRARSACFYEEDHLKAIVSN